MVFLVAFTSVGRAQTATPTIALDVTTAPAGGPLTVRVANGPGEQGDWAGLYDADGNAMQWQYLDGSQTLPASGIASAALTFMLPTRPGTYHACFFDASYALLATSGSVTTTASTITLGRTDGNPGVTVTATVANAPGWNGDWAGLYDEAGNNIEWQYLDGSHTLPVSSIRNATLTFTTPLTPGVYHARLFNGAYLEVAASGTITTTNPSITLGATTAAAGARITATIASAPGLPGDFAGLYDATGNNIEWQYLDGTRTLPTSGRTAATLAFTLPGAPGVFHARLFRGDYTQVAVSGTITTTAPTISLNATTGIVGGPVTATVTNGPGNPGDWVGLYDAAGTNVGWRYLNGSTQTLPTAGVTTATVTFELPASPGVFQARLYNFAYALLAASGTITTTTTPATTPAIALNAAIGAVGGAVAATVTHAPGWPTDFAELVDANGTPVQWLYLNGSQTAPAAGIHDAILTFSLPATPGIYRANLLNGYREVLASSGTMTVTAPTITSDSRTSRAGASLTVRITNAPGTPSDWVGLVDARGALVQWQHLNGSHDAPPVGLTSATLSFALPASAFPYVDVPASVLQYLPPASLMLPLTVNAYTVRLFNGANVFVGAGNTATVSLACARNATPAATPSNPVVWPPSRCRRTPGSFLDALRCLCE